MSEIYKKNYKLQTANHVKFMKNKYDNFKLKKYDLWKCLEMLINVSLFERSIENANNLKKFIDKKNQILDISTSSIFSKDEWMTLATRNKILYGTTFRHLYHNIKNWDWLPLVGLVLNVGKLLSSSNIGGADLEQISCDIFPLGCEISSQSTFYNECKKIIKKKSNSRYGSYKQFCGFDNLKLSYSYTSFLINQLQKYKNNRIPKEGMYLLKFCLLTAWHSPKEPIHRAYPYLASKFDWTMLPLLKLFYRCCFDTNNDFIDKLSGYKSDGTEVSLTVKDVKKEYLRVKRKYLSRWVF